MRWLCVAFPERSCVALGSSCECRVLARAPCVRAGCRARSPVDFKFSVSCPIKSLSRSCVRPDCYGRSAGFAHGAAEAFPCELSLEKKRRGGVGCLWPPVVAMVPPPPVAKCYAHEDMMMGNDECASCASCVMMVTTANCGGDDGVLLMMVM